MYKKEYFYHHILKNYMMKTQNDIIQINLENNLVFFDLEKTFLPDKNILTEKYLFHMSFKQFILFNKFLNDLLNKEFLLLELEKELTIDNFEENFFCIGFLYKDFYTIVLKLENNQCIINFNKNNFKKFKAMVHIIKEDIKK